MSGGAFSWSLKRLVPFRALRIRVLGLYTGLESNRKDRGSGQKMLVRNVVNSRRYGKIVLATVVRMAWVNESSNQVADWLTRA